MPASSQPGAILVIGGHEDKVGDAIILRALAQQIRGGTLVVATVASKIPMEMWNDYERVFRRLGVRHLKHLHLSCRADALAEKEVRRIFASATGVFFTGGDQLQITSFIGDTPVSACVAALHRKGGIVAGTSAGASVVCETMLVSGRSRSSPRLGDEVNMAPGLGLVRGILIDQHFAERGRIARLLDAAAQNPRMIGLGLDENTAVLIERQRATVIGAGSVYVIDASEVTYSNLTEEEAGRALSLFNVRLHVLSQGDTYTFTKRVARSKPASEIDKAILGGPES